MAIDDNQNGHRKPLGVKAVRPFLTTREIWLRAFETLHGIRKPLLVLTLFGLLGPQLVFRFLFDLRAESVVQDLQVSSMRTSGSFQDTLLTAYGFLGPYTLTALILWFVFLAVYLGLVHMAVHYERSREALSARASFARGLKSALPGGIVLTLFLVLGAAVAKIALVPAVFLAALCLIAPVLMVAESRGAFSALRHAVALRYLRRQAGAVGPSGWNVSFMLIVQGCFCYAVISLTSLGALAVLDLDRYLPLPRGIWTTTFPDLSFGPVYLAVSTLETVITLAVVSVIPAVTTAVYFLAAGKRDIASA